MIEFLLSACGVFYAILCVFSIVTGLMYATGRRELNPVELSDETMARLSSDPEGLRRFATKMGWVTVVVGVVQGITAYCIVARLGLPAYCVAVGFTLFSIMSVAVKLRGRIGLFPLSKCVAYLAILAILLMPGTGMLFMA